MVVNAENGKVIQTLLIGDGCDGVAFDSKKKLIFASNGEGRLTVIKEEDKNRYKVVQTLKTEPGARTITLNKSTGTLYLPTADFGK